ncbi:histidinol-phosphate transaminase [Haliovirga abyssi]|uniref:Histidinol-phosphate aminotransferase n=1 Tax=Haliovirga abyssi TaxID=2996794 RepID=A0AAU9D4Z5_9FUSO|nr:histidinol-phosphate transaminase [Haliovirga abyssi]BDU49623.1 histidinol-phosphate aminotransferase [Haliovirga abyssi]
MLKKLVNENIKNLEPYKVPDLDYNIKLDANENPYPMPEFLGENIKIDMEKEIFNALWNYYPDAQSKDLREELAKKLKLKKENIILGNGSDELILNLMLTYVSKGKKVLIHTPTFAMYKITTQIVNGEVIEVPLNSEDFSINKDEMIKNVIKDDVAMTFITYPNNPTGNLFEEKSIIEIIEKAKGLVVIDEAYSEFAGKSFVDKVSKYENIAILRTFSKAYGIAGLRIGYMVASEEVINEVNKVRLPYNINKITQIIALKVLKNSENMKKIVKDILEERERMEKELSEITEIKLYKSDSNALFFKTEKAEIIFSKMLENKILIRRFKGDLKNFIRISIGRRDENDKVLNIIKELFGKN